MGSGGPLPNKPLTTLRGLGTQPFVEFRNSGSVLDTPSQRQGRPPCSASTEAGKEDGAVELFTLQQYSWSFFAYS